jgi:sugar lactone lactonase YvrE
VPRKITAVLTGFAFLESPRWHEGRIWFSDFYTYRVFSAAGDGSDLRVEAEVPEQPSGLGWLPDGRLLVVSMRDQRLLRREDDGALVVHAELGDRIGGFPNDMVVDRLGRAFVGNFGIDFRTQSTFEPATLLRVDPDGTIIEVARDLWFPNGSVITDSGTLVVGETFGNRISAFDVASDGSLRNRRTWAKFAELPTDREMPALRGQRVVAPDGCCLDAEGALWMADADGGPLRRVHEGGEIVEEINPGTGAFACMLGGDDGRTLFVCTAPDYRQEIIGHRRDASLLAVRVDVPHAGLP